MKRTKLSAMGLAVLAGCAPKQYKSEINWQTAEPTRTRYIVTEGEENFIRTREYFSYRDETGTESSLAFTERKIPSGNLWELIAVSGIQNKNLSKILAEKLPGLAEVLENSKHSIGEVKLEDLYDENNERTGTKVYLPEGRTEIYSLSTEEIK